MSHGSSILRPSQLVKGLEIIVSWIGFSERRSLHTRPIRLIQLYSEHVNSPKTSDIVITSFHFGRRSKAMMMASGKDLEPRSS
jgi:hypothetical protein